MNIHNIENNFKKAGRTHTYLKLSASSLKIFFKNNIRSAYQYYTRDRLVVWRQALLTVARRSRPRCCVQSAPGLVTRSLLCRERWFDNLTSLCDHFSKVDVPLCSEKNSAKCAIKISGTAGALRLVPEVR